MPGRKLLIVDDDPNEVLFLRNAFDGTASPIDIRHADCGEAALAEIPVFHPDLVLLDLNMPGMDGYDVLGRIRADTATQGLPTLIFSSSERQEDVDRSYRSHANAYVVKPRSFEGYRQLAESIERFWYETARL
ncbi:MAG: response regulator with CheY-like receiver domain and winged-helix DNA-binding domain [Xanthobacteraceae bacterium]|nr:MAG: response regulator with CheY-like receiver domain and winged-helix DNA-binding domain [Xanthobacteraceae bacterium]